ncbi:MAG: adenylate/guanylate cyclase domain-containing protein [Alphaproteobacteria bacterium]
MRPPRLETMLIAALTVVLAGLYLAARDAGPLQAVEGLALNQRFALRGPVSPGRDVTVVAIDEASLRELGRWPVSRTVLAEAVRRIAAAGASVIVVDLLLLGDEEAGADIALAAAMAEAGNVVVPYAMQFSGPVRDRAVPPQVLRSAYRAVLTDPAGDLAPTARAILAPLPTFLDVASPAHATVLLADNGHLRFIHPAIRYGDAWYPSLAVTAVNKHLGHTVTAADPARARALNYVGPAGSFPTWPMIDLIEGRVPPAGLAGRVVVLGATASGVGDRFVTPYDSALPGVEVFATAIDNLLHDRFLRRGPDAELADLAALLLAGIATAWLVAIRSVGLALFAGTALLVGWCAINLAGFAHAHLWLNFTFPALLIVAGTAVAVAGRGLREGRQRRRLTRYVSPLTFVRGRRRAEHDQIAAVMFVDLVGFTQVAETLPPAELTETLRGFHRRVEHAAVTHDGLVDNFIGDAVLVVFGLGRAPAAAARQALSGARAIVAAIADWNAERAGSGLPAIACGVGLHVGPVRVAEVGGATHAQITVTGDTVNVASRLEALTREMSATVIASDAVIDAAGTGGDFAALPPTALRGRGAPIGLWAWRAPN